MTIVLASIALLIAALAVADRVAGPVLRAWDAWVEWNHVQDERERLAELRRACGYGPRSVPS